MRLSCQPNALICYFPTGECPWLPLFKSSTSQLISPHFSIRIATPRSVAEYLSHGPGPLLPQIYPGIPSFFPQLLSSPSFEPTIQSRKPLRLYYKDLFIMTGEAGKEHLSHVEVERVAPGGAVYSRPTFVQKLKRSLRRFWWLYLLVLIAGVLVTVLPMYVSIYPRCLLAADFVKGFSSHSPRWPKTA